MEGFQSTLPARGATLSRVLFALHNRPFQSTLPARGATKRVASAESGADDFNPRSPHGERRWLDYQADDYPADFNPRSPHGERPLNAYGITETKAFQSTLPARGATGAGGAERLRHHGFQSTLPARGATCPPSGRAPVLIYFNPRSPHGERRKERSGRKHHPHFNPRSPHGERRNRGVGCGLGNVLFQSTLPARGATRKGTVSRLLANISIHAPRTGSDDARKQNGGKL